MKLLCTSRDGREEQNFKTPMWLASRHPKMLRSHTGTEDNTTYYRSLRSVRTPTKIKLTRGWSPNCMSSWRIGRPKTSWMLSSSTKLWRRYAGRCQKPWEMTRSRKLGKYTEEIRPPPGPGGRLKVAEIPPANPRVTSPVMNEQASSFLKNLTGPDAWKTWEDDGNLFVELNMLLENNWY